MLIVLQSNGQMTYHNKGQPTTTYSLTVLIMCFMDDTVYIDSSRETLQDSINLRKEFFDIHNKGKR